MVWSCEPEPLPQVKIYTTGRAERTLLAQMVCCAEIKNYAQPDWGCSRVTVMRILRL
jgi:hypothetical protein